MSFRGILLAGKPESLDLWIVKAINSDIRAMRQFARGLRSDLDAIKNAASEKWSNGPVEGHINRLKALKRQMYGRAGFELLREFSANLRSNADGPTSGQERKPRSAVPRCVRPIGGGRFRIC